MIVLPIPEDHLMWMWNNEEGQVNALVDFAYAEFAEKHNGKLVRCEIEEPYHIFGSLMLTRTKLSWEIHFEDDADAVIFTLCVKDEFNE